MVSSKAPSYEGAFSVDNRPFSGYNMGKIKNEVHLYVEFCFDLAFF